MTDYQYQQLLNILCKYTYPKDQFGFVTEKQVCEEISRVFNS